MSETYLIGGDTLQSVDNPNWQGQTFRVEQDHILSFIDLEMKGAMRIPNPVILLFDADAYHEPYGDYLSRDQYIVDQKASFFTTGRVRFSMVPYLLTIGSYYVIIVSNFPPLGGNPASWQYDKGDGAYPRGHRISSPDSGVTWEQHYFDDFMFAEFGNPPVLKPEPGPPIDNFATVDLKYLHNPTSITFTLATSVPCHLFCYYTEKKPLKHPSARTIRGLIVPWGTYFCFVSWKMVEQTEPGDTLYHTFEMPDWIYCQTKWFTFRGTIDAGLSPSVGPIFKHHHTGLGPTQTEEQSVANHNMFFGDHTVSRNGQKLTIPNRRITHLGFWIGKLANPTGPITFAIRRVTDDTLICSKVWGDASALTVYDGENTPYEEVEFDAPVTINEEVRIYAQFENGDDTNRTAIRCTDYNVKPDEHLTFFSYEPAEVWSDFYTNRDITYKYTYNPVF